MEKIFVVIPNWNGADLIAKSLESLQQQVIPITTIVVDNGSTDDSLHIIKTSFPDVQLIELQQNAGFAGGVNVGIKYALKQGASAIALLNNDAVADKYWVKKLANRLQKDENLGIVTSKILRADKKHLDSTGDFYTSWGTAFPRGRDEEDRGQFDMPEEVFSASGGASLYRSKVFQDVGFFDEDFFAYYEDVDLCFRARLAGWKVFYEPGAVVYHEVGATSSRIHDFGTYHGLKNIFFLSYKNLPLRLFIWQFPKRALYYTALHARAWSMGKPIASLKAIGKVLVLLPKKTVERWKIQRNRKLKTSDLNEIIHHSLPPSTKRKLGKT